MNDLYKKIENIISNACGFDTATKSDLDNLYMDSLTYISLIVDIEEHFSIVIPDDLLLMENFENKQQICKIVFNLLNNNERS